MTTEFDYDLFVIGGGSGGVRASRMAAQAGARVAIAEEYGFGGTCVIRGCIPKKLFVYASHYRDDFEDAAGFGWTVPETHFDWKVLVANKDKEIARLEGLYEQNVTKAGAEIIMERAEFLDPHTIHLKKSGRRVTAKHILIATGGRPSRDMGNCVGADHAITSNEAFYLETLPRRVIVAGGGYIAVEFANIFHGLGAEVTLVYRRDKILRGFDEDMRDAVTDAMTKKGIRIVTNRVFKRVDKRKDEIFAFTDHDEVLEADCLMLAIGRVPNTDGLGLEKAGVETGRKGEVLVDRFSQTNVDHIYAIGDVTDRLQLTPVALHEAMAFVKTVYDGVPTPVDHTLVPTAVFSQPEIGTVGLSEADALAAGHSIDVYLSRFRPLKHTLSGREERSVFKLIVDAETDRVLGCHIFGADAAEIVQIVAVALKMGATKAQFDATIALHPSAAEELVTMRTKSYSRAPA
ncbi:MAG: glutathione-disulfide reductase [Alphaproteobacteria bacterium]|nr:glutathione-disulfide reductase [Alphaproteobacteria bacterium]MBN9566676.1 glutathione-disulfide reductase [Alphaproteobacteria bacterium]